MWPGNCVQWAGCGCGAVGRCWRLGECRRFPVLWLTRCVMSPFLLQWASFQVGETNPTDPHLPWIFIVLKKKRVNIWKLTGKGEVGSVIRVRWHLGHICLGARNCIKCSTCTTLAPCHLHWERSWNYSHFYSEGEDLTRSRPQRHDGASLRLPTHMTKNKKCAKP